MKRRGKKNGRSSEVYTQKWRKRDEEKAETEEKKARGTSKHAAGKYF